MGRGLRNHLTRVGGVLCKRDAIADRVENPGFWPCAWKSPESAMAGGQGTTRALREAREEWAYLACAHITVSWLTAAAQHSLLRPGGHLPALNTSCDPPAQLALSSLLSDGDSRWPTVPATSPTWCNYYYTDSVRSLRKGMCDGIRLSWFRNFLIGSTD